MFFARIRFDTKDNINLAYDEKRVELFRKGNAICTLSGYEASIKESSKLFLEYGGFDSYEKADRAGRALLVELKLYCIDQSISIKISGGPGLIDTPDLFTDTGGFTTYGRKALGIPDVAYNDALGLKIYEVNESMDELAFIYGKANSGLIINRFTLSGDKYNIENSCSLISLSLLTIANAMNIDKRISFLLKIMAVEAMAAKKAKRDPGVIEMVNDLLRDVTDEKLRSYLGAYKNKSIGEKCTEIIDQYCSKRVYAEQSAVDFWIKCYKLRSRFVHCGDLNYEDVSKVDGPLSSLVHDLLKNYLRE